MSGKSSINLTALTTDEPAKPPGPHGGLFHPEFFEPADRLVVFVNASIEVIEFALAFLSIPVLIRRNFEKNPCRTAFREILFLPAGVVGPIDFHEFRWLASIFLEETVRFLLASAAISFDPFLCSFWCPLLLSAGGPSEMPGTAHWDGFCCGGLG